MPTDLDRIDSSCEKEDRREFINILKQMLSIDQDHRLTPAESLQHKFIKMNHLSDYGCTT